MPMFSRGDYCRFGRCSSIKKSVSLEEPEEGEEWQAIARSIGRRTQRHAIHFGEGLSKPPRADVKPWGHLTTKESIDDFTPSVMYFVDRWVSQ